MNWQRYMFEDAPSFDRAEARAHEEVARLALGPEGVRALRAALGKILQDLRGEDEPRSPAPSSEDGSGVVALSDRITVRQTGLASRDDWTPGSYAIRITFALGGSTRRAIVELPLSSGRSLIGRVVGVAPERLGASDLLTPVEQGILAFFAERVSSGLTERAPFLAPLFPISVLDIATESAPIPWGDGGPDSWYAVSGSALLVGTTVPYRLLLPWALLRQIRQRFEASPEAQERAQRRSLHLTHPLGGLRLALTGRIGVLTLRGAELAGVEVSDIVLLDETAQGLEFEAGLLTGTMQLAFDGHDEESGSIATQVTRDDGRLALTVHHLQPGKGTDRANRQRRMHNVNHPDGTSEPESTAVPGPTDPASTSPGSAEGRALAEEAPVHVRVEVGRVRVTLRELAQLAPGAILELHKDPAEPVSLMVEDRMIGRGELVRVEGELGVRILSLL